MSLIHRSLQKELMTQLSYNIEHNSERDFEQIGAPFKSRAGVKYYWSKMVAANIICGEFSRGK